MFRAALKPVGGRGLNNPMQRGAPLSSLPRRVAWVHPAGFGWPGLSLHRGCHAASSVAMPAKSSASSGWSAASNRYCTSVAPLSLCSMTRSACAAHASVEPVCR